MRAERLKQDYGDRVAVLWQAYELRPGTPDEGVPRRQRPGNLLAPSVIQLSEEVGLKMNRPSFVANSRPALEAAEYAREQGKFDEFHLGVFKAYWEEGLNIALRPVLRDIAVKSGLDADGLERGLDERRYAAAIERQDAEAKGMGISGIPAYIIGKYLIEGAQPYDVFVRAAELALKPDSG